MLFWMSPWMFVVMVIFATSSILLLFLWLAGVFAELLVI
jgi:hypothetical protein